METLEQAAINKARESRLARRIFAVRKRQKEVCEWLEKFIDTNNRLKPNYWRELFRLERAEKRMTVWYLNKNVK